MATIRLRVGLAGMDFALASGELYTCPEEVAARFVAAGQAEYVTPPADDVPSAVETASFATPEIAARVDPPRGRPRGKR